VITDDLADALEAHPGLTARQLVERVAGTERSGDMQPERAVLLALAGQPGRFCCDGSEPPRWWVVTAPDPGRRQDPAPPPGVSAPKGRAPVATPRERGWFGQLAHRPPSAAPSPERTLYPWQADALEAWARRGHRGVVEAVTGTGKTVLGLAALGEELRRGGQVLVLVPTIELMHQWRREIHRFLGAQLRVGCLGGAESASLVAHDVVVAVVNSARVSKLRPIRRDALLVADECHRYASAANHLALEEGFARRLGLSATYARDDGAHVDWLEPYFGGTCFEMGYRRAVADGVIARFCLALVGVELSCEERQRYEELSEEVRTRLARLVDRHGVELEPCSELIKALKQLAASHFPNEARVEARILLALLHERRRLLAETPAKLDALLALAPALRAAQRSIVFTQSIAVAEQVAAALHAASLRAGALHSQLPTAARREMLARFTAGSLEAIVAPRVLDEGIDVPGADLAVIAAASNSRRQMVQRMGRVLRRKRDHRQARIAVLYAAGTVEDPAGGAHEAFLSEAADVAEEVRDFSGRHQWRDAAAFLERSTAARRVEGGDRGIEP
jgi:superfamily II DNA or RNA helicase